ncbi:hypothetical protein BGZ83_001843 [Gryganskiella cystojenkinii]|nr:hypothetical protein BGZ83_001843 [Gryganskiella cystojenkinii]
MKNITSSNRIIDRLILVQRKTEAILTQQLELAEYPIPRLFIVLPEEVTKYDPGNWFRTKFRLHFICECGEHTKIPGSKHPNHLHLAKHGGYLVREPTKFFKKYGAFLFVMLELIKFGTSIAGHVVPTLASLKVVELAESVVKTVESVTAMINYSLQCIDNQLDKVQGPAAGDITDTESSTTITQQDLVNYLSDVEGLEGAELRQLGSFLKTSKDENLLGNLYRMTTLDGHVKWVCLDHYRAGYQEAHTQKLREVVSLAHGQFDEQLGKVTITLKSKLAASEFYKSLSKAKGILELDVVMGHECSRSELQGLEVALKKSRVSILRLDLCYLETRRSRKLLSTSTGFEAIFRIQENPNMRMIHCVLPPDVTKISSFQPKKSFHACKLTFDIRSARGPIDDKVIRLLVVALKSYMSLTSLDLESSSIRESGALALGEGLKTSTSLTTLNLRNNSIGDIGTQALGEALKTSTSMTTLNLRNNSIGDIGARALGEALKTNNSLISLHLGSNSIRGSGGQALGAGLKTNMSLTSLILQYNSIVNSGAQALGDALKKNTTLTTLDLWRNSIRDIGAQALGEALKTNTTLTSLDLRWNAIGGSGCRALGEALKTNTSLTSLNLWGNSIIDSEARTLGKALKTNTSLVSLALQWNLIGVRGAQVLGEVLKTNTSLASLNLFHNSIGDRGAQAMGEALKTNTSLTTLILGNNSVGDSGAQALGEALETNTSLTYLDLGYNSIGHDGAQMLGEELKFNTTLIFLCLSGNSIDRSEAQKLSEALKSKSGRNIEW